MPANAQAGGYNNCPITIYLTRHAQKQTVTTGIGSASSYTTDTANDFVALDAINDKGKNLDEVCAEADSKDK